MQVPAILCCVAAALVLPWGAIASGAWSAAKFTATTTTSAVRRVSAGRQWRKIAAGGCVLGAVGFAAWEHLPIVDRDVGPQGPARTAHVAFAHLMADVWTECAALVEAGQIKTDVEERDWLEARRKQAQALAFSPVMEAEMAAFEKGWTPTASAALRRQLAAQARGVR